MNATRPKKKIRHRKNKINARKRKQVLLTALEEAIAVARGEHSSKKAAAPAKKETAKKPAAKKPAAKKETKKAEKEA